MNNQLHKALSLASASLVLAASPSYGIPAVASKAKIYGHITANGSLQSGSVGISTVRHRGTGLYCIKPSSMTLQSDVTYDEVHRSGFVDVKATQTSISWPPNGRYQIQVTGGNVTAHCASDEIAVTIRQFISCSVTSCTDYYYEDSDFTVMFD